MYTERTRFLLKLKMVLLNRTFIVYGALAFLLIISELLNPGSLSRRQLLLLIRQAVPLAIISIGQTLVILTGGIDLSVSSNLIFTFGMMPALTYGSNSLIPQAFLVCLAWLTAFGLINGIGVAMLGLSPLIVTLGTSSIVQGLLYLYVKGAARGSAPPLIGYIGTENVFGFPISIIIWLVIAAIFILILRYTKFGLRIYSVGSNPSASYMTGVPVKLTIILVYVLSAWLCMVAGIVLIGYLKQATLAITQVYTLDSIAAVVLGGTKFIGGEGGILGTIAGTLILRFLSNLLVIFKISYQGKQIAQGLIILLIAGVYSGKRIQQSI